MIRLLLGITLSEYGGSQRVLFGIMEGLPEDVFDVTLLTAPGGELLDWVAELNKARQNPIKVITEPCLRRDISLPHDVAAFLRALFILLHGKYDIAHFHNSKMGIIGRLAAKLAGVPRIYYTVHGWGLNPNTTGRLYGVMSFAEHVAALCTTEVIFVSKSDREIAIRKRWASDGASRVIYNGINAREPGGAGAGRLPEIPDGVPVIAFVARLAEPKDPQFAIRVSAHLSAEGCDHRLLIIGDGPLHGTCEGLVREQGPLTRVMLLGFRPDVRAILEGADVFCLFTKREGLPVSVIEAMFAGLPVVASAVGGVPELVQHGKTGFLLEGFDEDKASGLLASLLRDRQLRLDMGRLGRARAMERYTLEGMAADYLRLYTEPQAVLKRAGRMIWS